MKAMRSKRSGSGRRAACAAAMLGAALAGAACSGGPSSPQRGVDTALVARDVPPILRGTVGAQATLSGMEPSS